MAVRAAFGLASRGGGVFVLAGRVSGISTHSSSPDVNGAIIATGRRADCGTNAVLFRLPRYSRRTIALTRGFPPRATARSGQNRIGRCVAPLPLEMHGSTPASHCTV